MCGEARTVVRKYKGGRKLTDTQMQMEIAELEAEVERQKQYCHAYKALMKYWQKQNYEANIMLDEIFNILEVKING